MQGVVLARAELPAADSTRFAAVAQAIERDGVWATWREEPDPIGFPLWVVAVRRVLLCTGLVDSRDWAVPLQVGAALPLMALPALVYLLLRRLVGDGGGLVGAAFFSVATELARLGAAGIADSLLLSLQVLALLAFAEHLACGRRWWLVGAGVLCGGAMLVKGMSILLPAGMVGALVWEAARRVGGGMVQLGRGAVLAAGYLAVLVPAAVASGASTPQAVIRRLCWARVEEPVLPLNAPRGARRGPAPAWQEHWRLANGEWMTFGKKDPRESIRFFGWVPAGWELFREVMQGLLPWGLALAAWGGWVVRGWLLRPIDRMAVAVCGVWCLGAWCYATRTGYLSTRHVLPVVVLACGWCGLGVLCAGRAAWRCCRSGGVGLVARGGGGKKGLQRRGSGGAWAGRGRVCGRSACVAIVGAAAIAAALPRTLAPFHAYRAAHRQAGLWLAEAGGEGSVLDTHAWTGLYSGRPTWRFDQAEWALVDPCTAWLVAEEGELTGSGRRARTLRALAETGVLAASFVSGTGSRQTRVVVFRWDPMVLAGGRVRHAR